MCIIIMCNIELINQICLYKRRALVSLSIRIAPSHMNIYRQCLFLDNIVCS